MIKRLIAFTVLWSILGVPAARADPKFQALAALTSISAAYDVGTTLHALNSCGNCYEGNPVVHPAGKPGVVVISGLTTAAVVYGSHYMKSRGSKWWWAPMAAAAALHFAAGTHNMAVSR